LIRLENQVPTRPRNRVKSIARLSGQVELLAGAKLSRRKAVFALLGSNGSLGASTLTEPLPTNSGTLVLEVTALIV